MNNTARWVYLRASEDRLPKASSTSSEPANMAVNMTDVQFGFEQWGATKNDDNSWSFISHNNRWLSSNDTNVYTVSSKNLTPSEKFVLENL